MSNNPIRIFIADDHTMFVEGLKELLRKNHIIATGTAHHGNEVMSLLNGFGKETDLVIMDINIPGTDGLSLTKLIREKYPLLKVLIVSMYDEPGFIIKALESGAHGYLLKNSGEEELITAITAIIKGEQYIGKQVSQVLSSPANKKLLEKIALLTGREIEILKLLVEENSTKQIAGKLFISTHTVETHRKNLLRKLDVKSTIGLVRFAVENNI